MDRTYRRPVTKLYLMKILSRRRDSFIYYNQDFGEKDVAVWLDFFDN